MLVDLGRNDVGRVAATGTVGLTDRMVVELVQIIVAETLRVEEGRAAYYGHRRAARRAAEPHAAHHRNLRGAAGGDQQLALARRALPAAAREAPAEALRRPAPPDAYERLLQDAILGDPMLLLRSDEIEASWRYCDAVRAAWSEPGAVPLRENAAGTWGPAVAGDLFRGCKGAWTRG